MPKLEIHLPRTADHKGRLALALAAAAVAAAGLPASAAAQDFGSGEPALDEYVEALPLPHGNRAAGHKGRPGRLPGSTRRELVQTPSGRVIERLATSPAAGAPTAEELDAPTDRRPSAPPETGSPRRQVAAKRVGDASLLSSALGSAGAGTSGLLLLTLLASVPLVLILTHRRSRQR